VRYKIVYLFVFDFLFVFVMQKDDTENAYPNHHAERGSIVWIGGQDKSLVLCVLFWANRYLEKIMEQ